MGYEIRVVSNEEFDTLPYKRAKSSLGLADAKTGIAYVRNTGVKDIDRMTLEHEFDELLQKVSPHEADGIRYKSGSSLGKIFAPVLGLALAPFTGGLTAALAGAALGAGTGIHSSLQKPEKYGPVSFGNVLKDAALGGIGAYGGNAIGSGAMSGFGAAAEKGAGLGGKLVGGLKGAVGLPVAGAPSASPTLSGALSGANAPLSSAGSTLGNVGAVGEGFGSSIASAAPASSGLSGASLGSSLSSGAGVGTGLYGASTTGENLSNVFSGLRGGQQGASNLLNTFGDVANKAVKGVSNSGLGGNVLQMFSGQGPAAPVSQITDSIPERSSFLPQGNTQYELGSDYTPAYTQSDFDVGRRNVAANQAKRIQDIQDQFRTTRPGATPDTDTALRKAIANVNESSAAELEKLRSDAYTANSAKEGEYQNYQTYSQLKNNYNLDDSQMQFYIDLAKQPDSIISQYVASDPNQFKDIFGNLKYVGA